MQQMMKIMGKLKSLKFEKVFSMTRHCSTVSIRITILYEGKCRLYNRDKLI